MSHEQTPILAENKQTPLDRRRFLYVASRVGMVAGAISFFGGLSGFIAKLITDENAYQSALDQEAPGVDPTELTQAEDIRDRFIESAATPAAKAAASGSQEIYIRTNNSQALSEAIAVIEQQSKRDEAAVRISAEQQLKITNPFIYLMGGGGLVMTAGAVLDMVECLKDQNPSNRR